MNNTSIGYNSFNYKNYRNRSRQKKPIKLAPLFKNSYDLNALKTYEYYSNTETSFNIHNTTQNSLIKNQKLNNSIKTLHLKDNLTEEDDNFLSNLLYQDDYLNTNKDISLRYNVSTDLDYNEKKTILNEMSINRINHKLKSVNNENNIFYNTRNTEYQNPFYSQRVLNFNNELYKTLYKIRMATQYKKYNNKIKEYKEKQKFIDKMPKIRISKIAPGKKTNIQRRFSSISKNNAINNNITNNNNQENNNQNKIQKPIRKITSLNLFANVPNFISKEKLLNEINIFQSLITTQYHPLSRSQFCLCQSEEGTLFLYGGIQSKNLTDIWKCVTVSKRKSKKLDEEFFEEETELKWIKYKNIPDDEAPLPRYGHSMAYYKDNLYIFGGYTNNLFRNREDNVSVFDLKHEKFVFPFIPNNKIVPWRRNHIGMGVGYTMLIHGGIDDEGEYLNDIWLFDCIKYKWMNLNFRSYIKIPNIAYHSACLVIKSQAVIYHNDFNIYKYPEGIIGRSKTNKPKIEGVYIFGGCDENRNYCPVLWCIRVGMKPVDILKIPTVGKGPLSRLNCGMCFYNTLNLLVIHGGKNENKIFNDVMFLDLETLNWIKPIYNEENFLPFTEHRIFEEGNKIFILGGCGDDHGYHRFDFYALEFEIFKDDVNGNFGINI